MLYLDLFLVLSLFIKVRKIDSLKPVRKENHPLIRTLLAVNCRFTIEGEKLVMKGSDFTG